MERGLEGKVALVAGGTRGAGRGISVELGAAGATVYVTGRTSGSNRSEMDRPETIEETAALVDEAGGRGIPVRVDHLEPEQVRALVERIDREQGRLDVLVNDVWGGDPLAEWNKPVWEHSLEKGLRLLRLAVDTHIITDGTAESNATYRGTVGLYYDLAKASAIRLALVQADELGPHEAAAVSLTPGWLRSEMMLEHFGVGESNWQEATRHTPHFAISESPAFVGRAVAALAQDPDVSRWNGESLSSIQLARVYGFTDVDGSQPDSWRYLAEVQGKPADVTGYR
jgi:NAD(P)-dependent dehydrogenase (short-subunit alcohol dehydrogenase family)